MVLVVVGLPRATVTSFRVSRLRVGPTWLTVLVRVPVPLMLFFSTFGVRRQHRSKLKCVLRPLGLSVMVPL